MLQSKTLKINRCACTFQTSLKLKRKGDLRGFSSNIKCSAESPTYRGQFGNWKVDSNDLLEVYSYRLGLSATALTFATTTAANIFSLPSLSSPHSTIILAALGTTGLLISLIQIHIYVTPLKRFLQFLWLAGSLGGAYLFFSQAQPADVSLVTLVAQQPSTVWLIGPLFASLTGVCFKEGVCYGKWEAFLLTAIIPIWLLGHLSTFIPQQGEQGVAVVVALLLLLFAGRKYTQPVKDDIGDKSVFEFYKLSEDEQQRKLKELGLANYHDE